MTARLACLLSAAAASPLAAQAAEGSEYPAWYADPVTHTAFAAMALFLIIVWRMGGFKAVFSSLDVRAETIQAQLEEAKSLREQAKTVLADAERKQRAAEEQAAKIIAQSKSDAEAMMAAARAELADRLARREALADARIARAQTAAADAVSEAAADAATEAARRLLAEDRRTDFFETAASEIEKSLS